MPRHSVPSQRLAHMTKRNDVKTHQDSSSTLLLSFPMLLLSLMMGLCLVPLWASSAVVSSNPGSISSAENATLSWGAGVAWNGENIEKVNEEILDYALRRLRQEGRDVKTGKAYEVKLPRWTGAVQGAVRGCQVMRENARSLSRKGLDLNEFHLPKGIQPIIAHPYDQGNSSFSMDLPSLQLLLIYRRIVDITSNFTLYKLPPGYTIISPVVGITGFIYSPNSPLNTSTVAEVQLTSPDPDSAITIAFPRPLPTNNTTSTPLCAFFHRNGSFSFSNTTFLPNVCSSLIASDTALVMSPDHPSTTSSPSAQRRQNPSSCNTLSSHSLHPPTSMSPTFVLMVAFGGILALLTLVATMTVAHRLNKQCMDPFPRSSNEQAGTPVEDGQEALLITPTFCHTRAPTAPALRTRPTLEVTSLQPPMHEEI